MRGKSATCRRANLLFHLGLRPTTVIDRSEWAQSRQVLDLPRIRVAEPLPRSNRSSQKPARSQYVTTLERPGSQKDQRHRRVAAAETFTQSSLTRRGLFAVTIPTLKGPVIILTPLWQWLCHSDARRVCDLPAANLLFRLGSWTHHGHRPFSMGHVSASPRLAAHQSGRAIAAVESKFAEARAESICHYP